MPPGTGRDDLGGRTRPKVFGVGLPRTGTTSVAAAMLDLGYKTCHACFDDALFERGDAFFDTPVYADYRRLDQRFPGSRFILTWRDPHQWYASFARSLGGYLQRLRTEKRLSWKARVDRRCYALAFGEAELAERPLIARYLEHRRQVEEHFRDHPDTLLVLDVTAEADPWVPLCRFLDVPRPEVPFAHHNARDINAWKQIQHPNKLDLDDSPSAPGRDCRPVEDAVPARRCRVSLTMIVRNEEENLPACLDSAAGLFDEAVVVDTGSTDRTAAIARSSGARVFDFVWVDDFAAARNAALARATGDYAFWLDARDRIGANERAELRALLDRLMCADAAYLFGRVAEAGAVDSDTADATFQQVRLFPVRPDVRWSYPVREQIAPALIAAGIELRPSRLTIIQVAPKDPRHRRRVIERDVRTLTDELQERPDDPFLLFHLGTLALERRDARMALSYLEACLQGPALEDVAACKVHALRAQAYQMLGDSAEALAACTAGRTVDPDDAELLFREGWLRHWINDTVGAEACWRRILGTRPLAAAGQPYALLAWRHLALLAEEQGALTVAAGIWSEILADNPQDPQAAAAQARLAGAVQRPRRETT